jgi:hypothetical protein
MKHRFYYLREDKSYIRCSNDEWSLQMGQLTRENAYNILSNIIKEYRVSTVWLGIDHNFFDFMKSGVQEPQLFETMIIKLDDDTMEKQFLWRYSMWEEAERGHKSVCHWIEKGMPLTMEHYDVILSEEWI